jgi:hypothetical protein
MGRIWESINASNQHMLTHVPIGQIASSPLCDISGIWPQLRRRGAKLRWCLGASPNCEISMEVHLCCRFRKQINTKSPTRNGYVGYFLVKDIESFPEVKWVNSTPLLFQ